MLLSGLDWPLKLGGALPPLAPDSLKAIPKARLQPDLLRASMAGLWSPVKSGTEMQDSVHERRGGGGDVERSDPAAAGEADQLVSGGGDPGSKPPPLGAQHEHDATAIVGPVVRHVRIRGGAVDPRVALLRGGEPVGEVPHPRY